MKSESNLLISHIYDTCLTPDNWSYVLDEFAHHIHSKGAVLLAQDLHDSVFNLQHFSSCHAEADIQYYVDNLMHHEAEGWERLEEKPPCSILTTEQIWPDKKTLAKRPDFEFLADKARIFHRWGTRLNVNSGWMDGLGVQYDYGVETIPQDSLKRASAILQHMAKAIEISRTLIILRSRFNAILSALDHVQVGMFVMSADARVEHFNQEAKRILEQHDGLILSPQNRLTTSDANQTAQLTKAIHCIARTATGKARINSIRLNVPRRSKANPFVLEVSPLRDTSGEISQDFHGALVTLIDPDNPKPLCVERIATSLGLTNAEKKICQGIVDGLSTPEIAASRDVSQETVRSQVKSIHAKAGVNCRSEFLRLAMTIDPPVDTAPKMDENTENPANK